MRCLGLPSARHLGSSVTIAIRHEACKLADNPKVTQRIRALQGAAADVAILKAGEILTEVRRLCLSDISGIMHPDGRVKLPHELDADTRAAVASFVIGAKGVIKYRSWDKNAALEKAATFRDALVHAFDDIDAASIYRAARVLPGDLRSFMTEMAGQVD